MRHCQGYSSKPSFGIYSVCWFLSLSGCLERLISYKYIYVVAKTAMRGNGLCVPGSGKPVRFGIEPNEWEQLSGPCGMIRINSGDRLLRRFHCVKMTHSCTSQKLGQCCDASFRMILACRVATRIRAHPEVTRETLPNEKRRGSVSRATEWSGR